MNEESFLIAQREEWSKMLQATKEAFNAKLKQAYDVMEEQQHIIHELSTLTNTEYKHDNKSYN